MLLIRVATLGSLVWLGNIPFACTAPELLDRLYDQGYEAIENGQFDRAIELADRAARLPEGGEVADEVRSMALLAAGKTQEASVIFNRMAREYPLDDWLATGPWFVLAVEAKWPEALDLARRVLTHPENARENFPWWAINLHTALQFNGESTAEAEPWLESFVDVDTEDWGLAGPVCRFLLGKITAHELWQAAGSDRALQTEAAFYLALDARQKTQPDLTIQRLQWLAVHGSPDIYEWALGRALLPILGGELPALDLTKTRPPLPGL